MSIEAESATTGNGRSAVSELPTTITTASVSRPKLWQRRRFQLAAVLLTLLLVGAAIGNNLFARQYTPDGAVRQYLGALQSGDAALAWSIVQVAVPTQPAAARLLDQEALKASLRAGRPDIRSFAVTSTSSKDSNTAIVAISYDTSNGSKQAKFVAQRSGQTRFLLYPVWRLVITPTLLSVSLPKGSAGITVDGKALALPDGKSTVAVLPIPHKLQFNGTQMLSAQTVSVDAFFSLAQPVAYQPTLTSAGMDKAKAAITAAFAACAQQGSAQATAFSSCPQSADTYFSGTGQWRVVADPVQDLAIRSDQDLNIVGVGHYQMVFAYRVSYVQGTIHLPASGPYSAPIALTANDLSVSSIGRGDNVPALQRPAGATDQAARDLVATALPRCAAVPADNVADCPQLLTEEGTNVRWSLSGDPLANSTVSFDQNSGQLTVHGNFAMSASYKWLGIARHASSYSTAYNAYLFWDGQSLQLVTIKPA